jgi:glycosyltransferase involved in cell wall biosynthesis
MIKVLHVVGSLERGGIETWLMNVLRERHPALRMDFLLNSKPEEGCSYANEARAAGCAIYHHKPASSMLRRLRILGLAPNPQTLREVLERGQYDAVHVHGGEFNGDAMREAYLSATPVRIAHCHSNVLARAKTGFEMRIRLLRHQTLDRIRLLRYATNMLACSRDAGRFLVGKRWDTDSRCQVLYCGIPLDAFESALKEFNRAELLKKYNLPIDAKVIGHAGSMGPTPIKNHEFLVHVFSELAKKDIRYRLFLAGDGPLRDQIKQTATKLGILDKVIMPGVVDNVPALMIHLFDVHVMPSIAEGFGMAVTEATAAGLCSVISDSMPAEVSECLPGRTCRVPLKAPLKEWVEKIELALGRRELPELGIERVRQTPLCIEKSVESLVNIYNSAKNKR